MKISTLSFLAFVASSQRSVFGQDFDSSSCPSISIEIGGSSDLEPLVQSWIDGYKDLCPSTTFNLAPACGSNCGARRVCDQGGSETPFDVGTLSREWYDTEATTDNGFHWKCTQSDRELIQIDVATFGLAIAVKTGGTAHQCIELLGGLTMDQLRWIYSDFTQDELIQSGWDPSSLENDDDNDNTHLWSELDARCVSEEILISGGTKHSQNYQFFWTETMESEEEDIPIDSPRRTGAATFVEYIGSDTTEDLIQFLSSNGAGITYLSYESNVDYDGRLTTVPIENHYGIMVTPDASNIAALEYTPFSRKMHMNVLNDDEVVTAMRGFFNYAYSEAGKKLVESVGYFPIRIWEQIVMRNLLGSNDVDMDGFQCGSTSGDFEIAGSLSAHPIAQVWSEIYMSKCSNVNIKYRAGGSTFGAERVCGTSDLSKVDIGTMSRQWRDTEATTENGYKYECIGTDKKAIQIEVAIEALAVTFKKDGIADDCIYRMGGLKIDHLRWMFSNFDDIQLREYGWDDTVIKNSDGDPTTHLWSELMEHPDCPATEIKISGISDDSTINDFFTEFVLPNWEDGEDFDRSRESGFFTSDNEADLVKYLDENGDAISFFGYPYYAANSEKIWAAKIKNDRGLYIDPLEVSVQDGSYTPFSRRLYMNVHDSPSSLELTRPFLDFGLSKMGEDIIRSTGYIPIPEVQRVTMRTRVQTPSALPPPKIDECGPVGRELKIAGSTVVFPIVSLWAGMYEIGCNINVLVEGGGSHRGADRVCGGADGPVDIGTTSRDWRDSEAKSERSIDRNLESYQCRDYDTSRSAVQIPIAIDGLTIATATSGVAKDCIDILGGLTRDQLRWIFSSYPQLKLEATGWNSAALKNSDADDETHLWSELDSRCESTEILVSGPDSLRGSFYYMEETILTDYQNGEYFDYSRRPNGYFNSGNDDDLVEYILKNDAALSFFEFAYYAENKDLLYPVPIQNSQGQFVTPSLVSVKTGQYEPLARRVYVNLHESDESLSMTAPFIKFGLSDLGFQLIEIAGLAPLSAAEREAALQTLYATLGQDTPNDGPHPAGIAAIVVVCLVLVSILAFVVIRKSNNSKEIDSGEETDTTASPYSESRTNWAEQDPEAETAQKEVV